MRGLKAFLTALGATLACASIFADVQVEGDRIVADTPKGRVVVERGEIVEVRNRLTQETYTLDARPSALTGLRWHRSRSMLGDQAQIACAKTTPNEATLEAALPAGHVLTMTVGVDPDTHDVLIRQSARTPKKGLFSVQWGITGLSLKGTRCMVPGYSGVCLDGRCPARNLRFTWPVGWEVQMMVVEGKRGGFAVWTQDTDMRFKALDWRRSKEQVTLSFESQNHAPMDDLTAVESVEWRLGFFQGDWRVPAKRYRDWMNRTWKLTPLPDQRPAWVKDIRFLVIMGTRTETLDALKERIPPSATLLYIPAWRRDGYDRNYPDYTAKDGFAEFVRYAMDLGYHVMPHMNYFGCDPKHAAYERFERCQLRSPFSKEPQWWIPPLQRLKKDMEPTIKFAYIHPGSREWRDELTTRLVEAQRRYGFDAMHLDQTLCIPNHAGGKVDGLYAPQGNILLHRQLREAMPQVALSGEGLNEVTCHYEAFAQRHAARAVNHVYQTWDDGFIACGHPISSYFFAPYTKIYGYLGMSNPANRELYLAWKRAYENWGVIPTYSRPSAGQIESKDAAVRALFKEAQVWVTDLLAPDFETPWKADTKFRLKGPQDTAAVYARRTPAGSRMLHIVPGRTETVYEFIKGQSVVTAPGSIPDWFGYGKESIFGLNPNSTYVYLDEPRDLQALHVSRFPKDAVLRVLMHDDRKLMVEARHDPGRGGVDFVDRIDEAEAVIVVDGKESELAHGADFRALDGNCGTDRRRTIFAHPPWRVKAEGPEPARTVGRYAVDLPADANAFLEFAIGLREGVAGRSDGVQFQIQVDGKSVFDEVWDKSEWKAVSVPLTAWRGKHVTIAFLTTPGPSNNPSFDWAMWGEPRIRLEAPPRRGQVQLSSPRPVGSVVGTGSDLAWARAGKKDGMCLCDVTMTIPGRAIFLWTDPEPVALPVDLALQPFTVSVAVNDAPAGGPIRHAGASPAVAKSGGIQKSGINAHPPNHGRTSVDYLLQLPDKRPITLSLAAGLRDGSQSDGLIFLVEGNGRELYRQRITSPDGWHPATVDLSEFAGKTLLLSLVADADGSHAYDWATWAEPCIK